MGCAQASFASLSQAKFRVMALAGALVADEAVRMHLVEESSAQALLAEALPRFAAREVEYNMTLGVLSFVAREQHLDPPAWIWSVRDGAQLVGLAVRTPPLPLLISPLPGAACGGVAEAILARGAWPLPIHGPSEVVDGVTEQLAQRARIDVKRLYDMRLFQLRRLLPPPPTPGAMRRATQADAPMLIELLDGFERETVPEEAGMRDLNKVIAGMLAARRAFLWQDGDVVGAMAAFNRRVGSGTSIGAVYARPALRRRGYATALVAALSQHMLDDGCQYTCLNTDLANPTSNSIYPKVGYEPVLDMRHVRVQLA